MTSGGQSEQLSRHTRSLAGTAAVETALGDLNRRSPTAMDPQNPDRGPLLLISCQRAT
jgi:hypothetical protein